MPAPVQRRRPARTSRPGIRPVIDSNHEYSVASGSKWTLGSYSGTAVAAANVGAGGVLTVPKTSGLYTNNSYYLTVSPKGIAFTVEYYFQSTTSDTTYTIDARATTNDTAPFGWTVEAGTTAGTAGNAITIVRKSFTASPMTMPRPAPPRRSPSAARPVTT